MLLFHIPVLVTSTLEKKFSQYSCQAWLNPNPISKRHPETANIQTTVAGMREHVVFIPDCGNLSLEIDVPGDAALDYR
jgi:hypothetical protein